LDDRHQQRPGFLNSLEPLDDRALREGRACFFAHLPTWALRPRYGLSNK
jgi:hypothetical protein